MVLNRKGFFLELGDHQAKAPETKSEAKQEKAESMPAGTFGTPKVSELVVAWL